MNASLSARPMPAPVAAETGIRLLPLPGVEQGLPYLLNAGMAVARGLVRRHALNTAQAERHGARFNLTPELRRRWHSFFRTDATREIDYSYHQSAATLMTAELLAELGINLGQVTLLRQVTQHVRHADPLGQVPQQRLDQWLQRVTPLNSGVLCLVLATHIRDSAGQLLATQEDHYAVRGLDTADLPGLQHDRSAQADFAQLKRRNPVLDRSDANVGEWVIGADWGRHYGQLTGELAPVHRSRLGARLMGWSAPTLQAGCMRNLVVRQLADVGLNPERLDIRFCRPTYLNQRIAIVQRDGEFEISDARGVLLAYGRC